MIYNLNYCLPFSNGPKIESKPICWVSIMCFLRLRKVTTHLDIDSAVDCPITLNLVVISTPIDFMLWLYCKGNKSESSL